MPRTRKDDAQFEEPVVTQSEADVFEFLQDNQLESTVVEIYEKQKDGRYLQQERIDIDVIKSDPFNYLRENYDCPGTFMLRFKTHTHKYLKNITLYVGAGPRHLRQRASVIAEPTQQAAIATDFTKEVMFALLASLKPQPQPDMGSLLSGLAAIMAALRPQTNSDPAAMLTAMATTWSAVKPKESDSLSQFKEMVSLTRDLMPESGPKEENVYSIVKEVGNKIVDTFAPRPGGMQQPQQQQIAGNPAPVAPTTTSPREEEENIMLRWLKAQIAFLKEKARIGKPTEEWVEYLWNNQEEPGCQAILDLIDRGVSFEQVLQFDTEIANNPTLRSWFERLYTQLRTELQALDTSGSGGDAPDTGNHAGVVQNGLPAVPESPRPSGPPANPTKPR